MFLSGDVYVILPHLSSLVAWQYYKSGFETYRSEQETPVP